MIGQGWTQVGELALAFVLSATIGLERQLRQKSAGLRTHTIVGLGSALFLLVSKYGFQNVVVPGQVVVDPSRVAAQIVSGLGFIGAGLIFVQRGSVRGLTTAATIWLTAAIATAAAGRPADPRRALHRRPLHRAVRADPAGPPAVRAPAGQRGAVLHVRRRPRRAPRAAAHLHRLRLGGDQGGDPGRPAPRSARTESPAHRWSGSGWSCTARARTPA